MFNKLKEERNNSHLKLNLKGSKNRSDKISNYKLHGKENNIHNTNIFIENMLESLNNDSISKLQELLSSCTCLSQGNNKAFSYGIKHQTRKNYIVNRLGKISSKHCKNHIPCPLDERSVFRLCIGLLEQNIRWADELLLKIRTGAASPDIEKIMEMEQLKQEQSKISYAHDEFKIKKKKRNNDENEYINVTDVVRAGCKQPLYEMENLTYGLRYGNASYRQQEAEPCKKKFNPEMHTVNCLNECDIVEFESDVNTALDRLTSKVCSVNKCDSSNKFFPHHTDCCCSASLKENEMQHTRDTGIKSYCINYSSSANNVSAASQHQSHYNKKLTFDFINLHTHPHYEDDQHSTGCEENVRVEKKRKASAHSDCRNIASNNACWNSERCIHEINQRKLSTDLFNDNELCYTHADGFRKKWIYMPIVDGTDQQILCQAYISRLEKNEMMRVRPDGSTMLCDLVLNTYKSTTYNISGQDVFVLLNTEPLVKLYLERLTREFQCFPEYLNYRAASGENALQSAIRLRRKGIIDELIKYGAVLDAEKQDFLASNEYLGLMPIE